MFSRASGSTIWDPEGKRYIDFLAAYSAVNQVKKHKQYLFVCFEILELKKFVLLCVSFAKGHCHPKIIKALQEQVEKLTLSSRAFHNDKFPVFAERLTNMFGYEMVLPMNTGAEGVETALKLARKWGHEKKHIPKDEVKQLFSFKENKT